MSDREYHVEAIKQEIRSELEDNEIEIEEEELDRLARIAAENSLVKVALKERIRKSHEERGQLFTLNRYGLHYQNCLEKVAVTRREIQQLDDFLSDHLDVKRLNTICIAEDEVV